MALAPYALVDDRSVGRAIPEPRHPYRSDFQRDRDRIIHARAFRRLENKTQVFTRRYSDHFRNRLTHTLEVTQISRTVAGALRLNGDLVETLALAHDLGHPPFGHAGEGALDAAMRRHGDSFEHNLHALRIVEQVESRYAAFRGLNLTFEVREGIVKHSRDYEAARHPELAEYRLDAKPPLEAQLIDLTDEIGYSTADLDDGFEAHLLSLRSISEGVPLFGRLLREFDAEFRPVSEKLRFNEVLRRLIDRLVTDLIEATAERARPLRDVEEVRASPERLAGFSPGMAAEQAQLKAFLYANIYEHPVLKAEKARAARTVGEMFDYYLEDPSRLPRSYQERLHDIPVHRVVCDYIAGMTDSYIANLWQKSAHDTPALA
jgi:dGTPase